MFDKQALFDEYYNDYMYKVAYSANMDTYNRRYMNIANPSQVQRWRSRGFSDAQIRAYTDSQVRKSMGGYTPTAAGRYNNNMLPGQPTNTQQYNNTYRQNNQYQFRSRQPYNNQYNSQQYRTQPSSSVATSGGYTTSNTNMSPQMDTYNRRYANIANPAQINRWKANGFSDSQIRQYTDSQVRKSMTSRGY